MLNLCIEESKAGCKTVHATVSYFYKVTEGKQILRRKYTGYRINTSDLWILG